MRYECLDARDDYAAQMKKGENVGIFSNWDIYDSIDSAPVNINSLEGDDFTVHVTVIFSMRMILDLRLQNVIETCYMWNK